VGGISKIGEGENPWLAVIERKNRKEAPADVKSTLSRTNLEQKRRGPWKGSHAKEPIAKREKKDSPKG